MTSAKGGNVGIVWAVPPEVLARNVEDYGERVYDSLEAGFRKVAATIAAWAKANHRWNNITGEAEAGLECEVFLTAGGYKIVLWSAAPHGFWLEVAHGGVWGVVSIALQTHYGEIMEVARAVVGG